MNVAIVQTKPRKGKYRENLHDLREVFAQIGSEAADLIVLPEAALTGYFLEGAVYELAMDARAFADDLAAAWLEKNAKKDVDLVCGFYENSDGTYYNSAMYLQISNREAFIKHVHRKMFLPTYGVFDEERFVTRGRTIEAFDTSHGRAAILICEDACHSIAVTVAALRGAQILYIPSASPGSGLEDAEPANVRMWRDIMRVAAAEHGIFIVYAGLVGFEGGKGFTGASRLMGPFGDLRVEAPFDGAAIVRTTISLADVNIARAALPALGDLESNLSELTTMFDEEVANRPARPKARPRA